MRATFALSLIAALVGCPVVAPGVGGFATPCASDADCAGVCEVGVCRRGPAPPGEDGGAPPRDGGRPRDGGDASVPFFDDAWGYRVRVDVENPTAATLRDVPVVVRFSADALAPGAAAPGGRDVRFVDRDGATWPHEVERWRAGGERVVWVQAPELPPSSITSVWLYYANADAQDTGDGAAVFDNGYRAVWHLGDAPDGSPDDAPDATGNAPATSQNMDGTARRPGLVGDALALDGVDDRLIANAWQAPADALTIQLWFRFDAARDSADPRFDLLYHDSFGRPHVTFNREGAGRMGAYITVDTISYDDVHTDETSWAAGRWTFLAFTFDGTDWVTYVDGVESGPRRTYPGRSSASDGLHIGATSSGATPFPGMLDEIAISDVARSPEWIAFQYATQRGDVVTLAAPQAR